MRLFTTSSANEVSASVLGHFDPEIISSKNDAPFEEIKSKTFLRYEINLLNYFLTLCRIRSSIEARDAARVLPDPVGAEIRVCLRF
ncbi:MAG: hypothetical protein E4H21_04875 [Thermodesulfobacteriales bacterium]|jgi:hypothetical protein|nr:MAG: hypothetical protein E4H21_04875 [Thermodesulfobacteriales bacterium]